MSTVRQKKMRKFKRRAEERESHAKTKKSDKSVKVQDLPNLKLKRKNISYVTVEKEERKNAKEENEADIVQQLAGGRGQDVRAQRHTIASSTAMTVNGAVTNLGVRVDSDATPLRAAGIGLAAQLVKRGASTSSAVADSDISPWKAASAWYGMLVDIQKGEYPTALQLPQWMWNILQGMSPKTSRFKTGDITYSWSDPEYTSSNGLVQMELLGYFYSSVFGFLSTGATINGFPTIIPSNGPVVAADGVKSLTTLLTNFPVKTSNQKSVEQPENSTIFARDTTSLAMVFPEIGSSGLCDTGALVTTLYSERVMGMPLISGFTPYQPIEQTNRGTWEYRKWGASPVYLMGRAFECDEVSDWKNKLAPFIKFYNFDEYWIQLNYLLQAALNNNVINNPGPCPLSAQQVQILLRQELLPIFSNDLAFDLRVSEPPFVPIIPFQVGNNGAPTANAGMRLPRFFVESVRAVKRHVSELHNGTLVDYVPVLGRPLPTIIPQPKGFTGLFTPIVGPPPELFVDLIDLKADIGGTTYYMTVGGELYTTQLASWNNWISALQPTLTGLCTIGTEGGICALQTNVWSTHCTFMQGINTSGGTPTVGKSSKTNPAKRFGNPGVIHTRLDPTPDTTCSLYKEVYIKQDSCVNPMYTASYKYINVMVKPMWMSGPGNPQTGPADPTYLRSLYCETNVVQGNTILQTIDDCEGSPTLFDRIGRAAQLDVKGQISDANSEMETDMDALAAMGRGGFFTGLASMFGRAIGVPEISNVADAIGRVVDI